MLVSIIWSVHVPGRFKAPVCRLLRCLYVDREPQVEAKFPRLIKTSVSLSGGEENSFSDHHSGTITLLIPTLNKCWRITFCIWFVAAVDIRVFASPAGYHKMRWTLRWNVGPLVVSDQIWFLQYSWAASRYYWSASWGALFTWYFFVIVVLGVRQSSQQGYTVIVTSSGRRNQH